MTTNILWKRDAEGVTGRCDNKSRGIEGDMQTEAKGKDWCRGTEDERRSNLKSLLADFKSAKESTWHPETRRRNNTDSTL